MKNNKGFSLVELIVVIAIMAILAAVAIPTFAHFIKKSHEASDAELLHNINYTFNLSCLDNGVDIKDVDAANFDVRTMTLSGVRVNGASDETNTAIVDSFELHFGELKEEKFYYIERLEFDYVNKEFIEYVEGEVIEYDYGGGKVYLRAEDIEALKKSTFGTEMGVKDLLDQLNEVTDLAKLFAGQGGKLEQLFTSDGFLSSFANSLNITGDTWEDIMDALMKERTKLAKEAVERFKHYTEQSVKDGDISQADYDALVKDYESKIEANAAVLYAAQCTAQTDRATINGWIQNPDSDTIKGNLTNASGKNTTATGLTQAALMCGMYTSYVNCGEYTIDLDRQTVNPDNVLWAIDSDDTFRDDYLKNGDGLGLAAIDLEGYLASLNMIYMSTTNNPDAVRELLINGFADPNLKALMGDAVGTNQ